MYYVCFFVCNLSDLKVIMNSDYAMSIARHFVPRFKLFALVCKLAIPQFTIEIRPLYLPLENYITLVL